ncbi:MAG: M48 family metallopeptidase [Sterolibacterium sp.]|jgi:predicted Zn-dependent protease|nr:M48 family metallopeptidase [Sterolibacterium sp.]
MKLRALILLACMAPVVLAEGLPDLGEQSQVDFSPAVEKRTGEAIMRDIRLHEPSYVSDPEINGYLNRLGSRLVSQSSDARQGFEFFALRDPTLNAFAMPGGYIGVHTGLIMATRSESELASVLAHEISHVTQHHLARQISAQSQGHLPMLLALAVAILASRSNSDLSQGALMAGQAASIQNQLKYSRDFERESDRLGLQLLESAGFDVRAMADFFERLQKFSRLYENNAPGYLRTHPLTTERIADMANRIQSMPYRQVEDSLDYLLVRAKLKASEGSPRDAVTDFASQLRERKFTSEIATHYGYAIALMRDQNYPAAGQEVAALQKLKAVSPMIDAVAADLRKKQGDLPGALNILRAALVRYPEQRSLAYTLADTLLSAQQAKEALRFTSDDLQNYAGDARMHELQARAYAALGQQLQQHRAQAEAYALRGQLGLAIEQLQIAQKSSDGNYFERSQVDARLRELKQRHADELKSQKK